MDNSWADSIYQVLRQKDHEGQWIYLSETYIERRMYATFTHDLQQAIPFNGKATKTWYDEYVKAFPNIEISDVWLRHTLELKEAE